MKNRKYVPATLIFIFLGAVLFANGYIKLDTGGIYNPAAINPLYPQIGVATAYEWQSELDRHWSFFTSLQGEAHVQFPENLFGYEYLARIYFSYAASGFILIPELMSTGEMADNSVLQLPEYSRHLFSLETGFDFLGISFKIKPSISWQVDELILAGECESVFQLGDLNTLGLVLQADKTLVYQVDNYSFSQTLNFSFYQFEPFLIDLQLSALYNNSGYSLEVFEGEPAVALFDYWDFAINAIVTTYLGDTIITFYLPAVFRLKEHPVITDEGLGPEPEWQLSLEPDFALTFYWLKKTAWICDLQLKKIFSNDPTAESLDLSCAISFKLSF